MASYDIKLSEAAMQEIGQVSDTLYDLLVKHKTQGILVFVGEHADGAGTMYHGFQVSQAEVVPPKLELMMALMQFSDAIAQEDSAEAIKRYANELVNTYARYIKIEAVACIGNNITNPVTKH